MNRGVINMKPGVFLRRVEGFVIPKDGDVAVVRYVTDDRGTVGSTRPGVLIARDKKHRVRIYFDLHRWTAASEVETETTEGLQGISWIRVDEEHSADDQVLLLCRQSLIPAEGSDSKWPARPGVVGDLWANAFGF